MRHHLVDVADASKPRSAGALRDAAAEVIGDVAKGETARGGGRHDDVRAMARAGRAGRAEGVRHRSGLGSLFLAPYGDDWDKALERRVAELLGKAPAPL